MLRWRCRQRRWRVVDRGATSRPTAWFTWATEPCGCGSGWELAVRERLPDAAPGVGSRYHEGSVAAEHAVVATGRNPDTMTETVGEPDDLLVVESDAGQADDRFPELVRHPPHVQVCSSGLRAPAPAEPDCR